MYVHLFSFKILSWVTIVLVLQWFVFFIYNNLPQSSFFSVLSDCKYLIKLVLWKFKNMKIPVNFLIVRNNQKITAENRNIYAAQIFDKINLVLLL